MKDLAVVQKGRVLILNFTPPLEAADGERLTKPTEVEIFRSVTRQGEGAGIGQESEQAWAVLQATDLAKNKQGEKIVYPVALSDEEFSRQVGSTFAFAIRSLTRGFRRRAVSSELSSVVKVTLLDVSGPVQDLQVRAGERAMEVAWSPAARTLSGKAVTNLSGYRVYRSTTGEAGSFQLHGETAGSTYLDSDFQFNRTYYYTVRSVSRDEGQSAESEESRVAAITPRDTFPPAAPKGLNALYVAGAVELVWTANSEPDLAGYNVYRRDEGGPPQKVNGELLRTPTFRDSSVTAGHKYFYFATAVDRTKNESVRSDEVQVETR